MRKIALLIGVSNYDDSRISSLPAAVRDVRAMRDILQSEDVGEYQVTILEDPDVVQMQREIEHLFRDRQKNDLVLLFFSGHGFKDRFSGDLYFATRITQKHSDGQTYIATGVAARFVHDMMRSSSARRQVILLDCCFSGAFSQGDSIPRNDEAEDNTTCIEQQLLPVDTTTTSTQTKDYSQDIQQQLGLEGKVVLTSTTAVDYAYERQGDELAVYTQYLVEGLRTGAADLDGDGYISARELYEYSLDRLKDDSPRLGQDRPQKPKFFDRGQGYGIHIAKSRADQPDLIYRRKVTEFVQRARDHRLELLETYIEARKVTDTTFREILDDIRDESNLPQQTVDEIENEVLEPHRKYIRKREAYRTTFTRLVSESYPISASARDCLEERRKNLQLTHGDANSIEQRVLERLREANQTRYQEQFQAAVQQTPPFGNPTRQQLNNLPEKRWLEEEDARQLEYKTCINRYETRCAELANPNTSRIPEELHVLRGSLELDEADTEVERFHKASFPNINRPKYKRWLIIGGSIAAFVVSVGWYLSSQHSCPQLPTPSPIENQLQEPSMVTLPSGTFIYGGSTTWVPIIEDDQKLGGEIRSLTKANNGSFILRHKGLGGSNTGINEVLNKKISFALSSRPLTADEKKQGLEEIPVARDAIAIVVHPNLMIGNLTIQQLKQIYADGFTNWSKFGGPNLLIQPFARGGSSGTVDDFKEKVLGGNDFAQTVNRSLLDSTKNVGKVAENPGGIFFGSYPEVRNQTGVKLIHIENGDLSDGFTNQYPTCLIRELYVVTRKGSTGEEAGKALASFLRTKDMQGKLKDAGYGRIDGQ